MIRTTIRSDEAAVLNMLQTSGQFDEHGLDHVKKTLEAYFDGDDAALWFTADDGGPVGIAYCAPEPMTNGTWNLLLLWIRRDREGHGHGLELINCIEHKLAELSARKLIVETSGLAEFQKARAFYSRAGFLKEATIKSFFDVGDDKVVYTKTVIDD